MRFEYFRFLLTPIQASTLPWKDKMSRGELIEDIFSPDKCYRFKSGRATYALVIKRKIEKIVYARIGKLTSVY